METRKIELKGRHLKWLNDGEAFLAHVDDLVAVEIRAVCTRCHEVVHAAPHPETERTYVRCSCRAGTVKTSAPLELEPLLFALGWRLICPACGEGVRGDNARTQTTFTVACPCTTRVYRVAVH